MRSNQRRALAIALVAAVSLLSGARVWTVDRAWQTGVWKDVQVKRAKVVFGVAPGDPNSGGRRAPPPTRETRLYVIETDDLRLELKQDATVDTPRLDVLVGEPVTFAIEKNNVYVKDAKGRETKLSVTKKTSKK
jgi:hypothetical protein